MDFICLVLWIMNLAMTIANVRNGDPVNPVVCICALIICIIHYLEKVTG